MSRRYRFKYRLKRLYISWIRWQKKLDNKIGPKKEPLSPFEEKTVRLWKLTVKDSDTQLAYNSWGIRQIDKENLSIIFKPSGNTDYIMTIIDITDDRKSIYEIHIPTKNADEVCDYFDNEMDRRMREKENTKKSIIGNDLDRLLEQEEREVNRKKRLSNRIKQQDK